MTDTTALLPHLRLQFAIENVSLEDCWAHGYELASADGEENENPFAPNTPEHRYWSEGWWAGYYGEVPLFELVEPVSVPASAKASHAANDVLWNNANVKKWLVRVVKITSIIAIAVAAFELADLAA